MRNYGIHLKQAKRLLDDFRTDMDGQDGVIQWCDEWIAKIDRGEENAAPGIDDSTWHKAIFGDDWLLTTFVVPREIEKDTYCSFKPFSAPLSGEGLMDWGYEEDFGVCGTQRIQKALVQFVSSWVAFINDPKVLVVETHKSPNARLKLERFHGAMPKSMNAIRLTGVLRKYVQEQRRIADEQERQGVCVHWVRGHYRRLMAERYTPEKRGTMSWVPPHVRGVGGVLKRRTYEVALERNA